MLSRHALQRTRMVGILGAGLLSFHTAAPAIAQDSLFAVDSEWVVTDTGGTDTGTLAGTCDGSPGFTVADAFLGARPDAYDIGQTIWVDGVQFVAGNTIDATTRTVNAGPVEMSGLDVTVRYAAMRDSDTTRTLVGFVNRSANDIAIQVVHATNVSSNAMTVVGATSSGNLIFNTADTWVVTNENFTPLIRPAITHVHRGGGGNVASSVALTTFTCVGNQGVRVTYNITVPAGSTRYLLYFNSLSATKAEAVENAQIFIDPPLGGDLLFGLLPEQLREVLNWNFNATCLDALKQSLALNTKNGTMEYSWSRGAATSKSGFGDPLELAPYLVCIVDYVEDIPFIETCVEAPAGTLGWREKGNGYLYRSKGGEPDGLTRLKLRNGNEERGKITARAEGLDFLLPLSQDPEVRVLVFGNKTCWQGRFMDPAKKNDSDRFKAKQRFEKTEEEPEATPE